MKTDEVFRNPIESHPIKKHATILQAAGIFCTQAKWEAAKAEILETTFKKTLDIVEITAILWQVKIPSAR